MQHAATEIVPVSSVYISDACVPVPSSFNLLEQYKIIFRIGSMLAFDLTTISIALIKAHAVVSSDQGVIRHIFAKCSGKPKGIFQR